MHFLDPLRLGFQVTSVTRNVWFKFTFEITFGLFSSFSFSCFVLLISLDFFFRFCICFEYQRSFRGSLTTTLRIQWWFLSAQFLQVFVFFPFRLFFFANKAFIFFRSSTSLTSSRTFSDVMTRAFLTTFARDLLFPAGVWWTKTSARSLG